MSDDRPTPRLDDLLREAGFMPKSSTSAVKAELSNFVSDLKKAWKKTADDNGITTHDLAGEVIVGVIIAVRLSRAMRRGDIARTVRWSAATVVINNKYYSRRLEQRLDKIAKLVDIREA